jgi:hypothetical protein
VGKLFAQLQKKLMPKFSFAKVSMLPSPRPGAKHNGVYVFTFTGKVSENGQTKNLCAIDKSKDLDQA